MKPEGLKVLKCVIVQPLMLQRLLPIFLRILKTSNYFVNIRNSLLWKWADVSQLKVSCYIVTPQVLLRYSWVFGRDNSFTLSIWMLGQYLQIDLDSLLCTNSPLIILSCVTHNDLNSLLKPPPFKIFLTLVFKSLSSWETLSGTFTVFSFEVVQQCVLLLCYKVTFVDVAGQKRSVLPTRILPCYVIFSTFHLNMVDKDCSCYMNLIG